MSEYRQDPKYKNYANATMTCIIAGSLVGIYSYGVNQPLLTITAAMIMVLGVCIMYYAIRKLE